MYAAETGFILPRSPDTVRAADVAFISQARLPSQEPKGFGKIVPDAEVEVVSPSNSTDEVLEKTKMWVDAGVHCVVNVYPSTQTAATYRSPDVCEEFQADDIIDFSDVVQGWKPLLKTFFGGED